MDGVPQRRIELGTWEPLVERPMARTETVEQALAAARALGPQILAKREEMEAERRIPQSLVAAMKTAGLFRLSMPRAMGGPELTPMAQVQVVEALSMFDASVGWTAMLGLHAGYFTAFLDPAAARSMYVDLDAFTGGVTKPTGTAVVVPGGYRVSGRWTFGSSCQHSEWLFSGCVVVEDGNPRRLPDGSSETRLCYLPGTAIEVIDTWTSTGLRGTGSHDYTAADVSCPLNALSTCCALRFCDRSRSMAFAICISAIWRAYRWEWHERQSIPCWHLLRARRRASGPTCGMKR